MLVRLLRHGGTPLALRALTASAASASTARAASTGAPPSEQESDPVLLQYRSQYPPALWDRVAALAPHSTQQQAPLAVDVVVRAQGRTGVELARRGLEVVSVSSDAGAMSSTFELAQAQQVPISVLSLHAGRRMVDDGTVDLVTCMHQLHLLDTRQALQEAHRVLKPGGRLVAAWNELDPSDGFVQQLAEVAQRWVPSFSRSSSLLLHDMSGWAAVLQQDDMFSLRERAAYPNPVGLPKGLAALRDIALRQSFVQGALSGPELEAFLGEVHSLAESTFGQGPVVLPMVAQLFVLEREQGFPWSAS